MLISVVLPTYNRAQVISRCIDSVLSQKFSDFELVVVDDGSIDNTREIVGKYKDKRLKYFYKPNGGVSSARNFGILKSNGQYISFIDSDDFWLSNKLLRDHYAIVLNSEVNIFFSDLIKISSSNIQSSFIKCTKYFSEYIEHHLAQNFITISSQSAYSLLLKEVFIKTPTLTVHRDLFCKYGFFLENLKSAEDWELLLRFVENEPICYLNSTNVVVNASSDSLHLIHKERDHFDMISILSKIKNVNSNNKIYMNSANDGMSEMYLHLFWFYKSNRQYLKTINICIKAFFDTKKFMFITRLFYSLLFLLRLRLV